MRLVIREGRMCFGTGKFGQTNMDPHLISLKWNQCLQGCSSHSNWANMTPPSPHFVLLCFVLSCVFLLCFFHVSLFARFMFLFVFLFVCFMFCVSCFVYSMFYLILECTFS